MFDLTDTAVRFQKRVPALAQILNHTGAFGDLLHAVAENAAPVPRSFLK
jgi:hypothetical protein